jgi:hypothetical protein
LESTTTLSQYNDLTNGFTYNGHAYIAAFVFLTLAITLFFYSSASKKVAVNHYVAPLFIWLILNLLLAVYLKGAGFLIIPVYCGLFLFTISLLKGQYSTKSYFQHSCLVVVSSFIQMFPIGLGLKVLFGVHFSLF